MGKSKKVQKNDKGKKTHKTKHEPKGKEKKSKTSDYKQSCQHFQFINEEKVRAQFSHKIFMKAVSSDKALSKNEIKQLQNIHPLVKWYDPKSIYLCLVCGQAVDERHFDQHFQKNHCLALSFADQNIICTKCDKNIDIESHTLCAELLNLDDDEQRPKITKQSQAPSDLPAVGIHNLGNSCWMNSTLQIISRLNLLPEVLPSSAQLSTAFSGLSELLKQPGRAIRPSAFVSNLLNKLPFLDVRFQQDAYEFLLLFLDAMRDELGGTGVGLSGTELESVLPSLSTSIDKTVGFILKTSLRCESCNAVTYSFERTTMITLSVPFGGQPSNLEELLSNYFASCTIGGEEGEDGRICDSCKNATECTLTPSFETMPQVLILHLARFRGTQHGYVKNNAKVSVPDSIDLSEYGCEGSYEITGIISHHGTMEGGHYTSIGLNGDKWILFDDETVYVISKQEALSFQPYIILYNKK